MCMLLSCAERKGVHGHKFKVQTTVIRTVDNWRVCYHVKSFLHMSCTSLGVVDCSACTRQWFHSEDAFCSCNVDLPDLLTLVAI